MKLNLLRISLSRTILCARSRPYLCNMHNNYSTIESRSIKDEKKHMFQTLGDDLLEERVLNVKHKLLFNSYIKYGLDIPISYTGKKKLISKQLHDGKKYQEIIEDNLVPISLKFLENFDVNSFKQNSNEIASISKTVKNPVFPYQLNTSVERANPNVESENTSAQSTSVDDERRIPETLEEEGDFIDTSYTVDSLHWMQDYEVYDDSMDEKYAIDPSYFEYGTPDPNIPASDVPCGGCGAHLHCQNPSIPGYLPREIFSSCSMPDLKTTICQRCHLMKNHNMALNVNVNPDEYVNLLKPLRNQKALVVLMVDMCDFPCSIWPGILDILGRKRPLFIVGNKIDLIPMDKKGWLQRAEDSLRSALPPDANVKALTFISAKTGYGVEELITKIFKVWKLQGDVYLVGCTNVGKSSLFNSLLQSDMCKAKASDLVTRATTSPWPGTTLNLLKFPIMKPNPHELASREARLAWMTKIERKEKSLYQQQKRAYEWKETGIKSLVGHIGRTYTKEKMDDSPEDELSMDGTMRHRLVSRPVFNEKNILFAHGKWCFDTPGTVQPDQIIHLLTTEELLLTLPKSVICPRVLHLRPGQTLFIAGLGRLDFVESSENLGARFAVMSSNKLPITACYLQDAEEVYNSLLGTQAFQVPTGSEERLRVWPPLKGKEITLTGGDENTITADLVLSSAGWVAVNMTPGQVAKFQCWTPEGRGIHVRTTPLMKYVHLMRGAKPRNSVMYKMLEIDTEEQEV